MLALKSGIRSPELKDFPFLKISQTTKIMPKWDKSSGESLGLAFLRQAPRNSLDQQLALCLTDPKLSTRVRPAWGMITY